MDKERIRIKCLELGVMTAAEEAVGGAYVHGMDERAMRLADRYMAYVADGKTYREGGEAWEYDGSTYRFRFDVTDAEVAGEIISLLIQRQVV